MTSLAQQESGGWATIIVPTVPEFLSSVSGSAVGIGSGSSQSSGGAHTRFLRLDARCWSVCPDECTELYHEIATCLFLHSEFHAAQLCVEFALQHVRPVADRALFYELHIQSLNQQTFLSEALDFGLAYLRELGVELVSELTPSLRAWINAVPDLHQESSFQHHPMFAQDEAADPSVISAMSLLSALTPTLLFLPSPKLYDVSLTMLHLTQTAGVTPESGFAFAVSRQTHAHTHTQQARSYPASQPARGRCASSLPSVCMRASAHALCYGAPFMLCFLRSTPSLCGARTIS
jgi:hypothetical protein